MNRQARELSVENFLRELRFSCPAVRRCALCFIHPEEAEDEEYVNYHVPMSDERVLLENGSRCDFQSEPR